MTIFVDHFGIHREGEFVFLHEAGRSYCLTPGFEGLPSPFRVRGSVSCPHRMLDDIPTVAGPVVKHPTIRAFAPVVHKNPGVFWMPPEGRAVAEELLRMSVLVGSNAVMALWRGAPPAVFRALTVTNISPVLICGYDVRHSQTLRQLALLPRLRPLVFCGTFPPPCPHTQLDIPSVNIAKMPLKDIGWRMLKESL